MTLKNKWKNHTHTKRKHQIPNTHTLISYNSKFQPKKIKENEKKLTKFNEKPKKSITINKSFLERKKKVSTN